METSLRRPAQVVTAAPALTIPIRDPSDGTVLAKAVAGESDVLVTGDRDLLDVGAGAPLPILTPRGFWEMLRSGS